MTGTITGVTSPSAPQHSRRRDGADGRDQALIVGVGAAAGLLALIPALPAALRLVLVLGFVLMAPGTGMLCWWGDLSRPTRAVLVPMVGLSTVILLTTVEAFNHLWGPRVSVVVLAVVSVVSVVARYRWVSHRGPSHDTDTSETSDTSDTPDPPATPVLLSDPDAAWSDSVWALRPAVPSLAFSALGLIAWAIALPSVGSIAPTPWGLLIATPSIAVAVVLTAIAGLLAMRARSGLGLAVATLAVIAVERLTTSIGTEVPLYPWTYKHLAVVDYIDRFGFVVRGVDVYHNWPGMFALTAWTGELSGVAPITLAHWFTPIYHLGLLAAVYGAARAWRLSPLHAVATVFVLEVASFVAQDYFSPQAMGYLLAIGVLAVLGESATRRVAAIPAVLVFAAIVVTHQLTPYWLVLVAGALVVLRRTKPWWLPAVFAVMALGYLAYNYTTVSKYAVIASPDPLQNVRLTSGTVPEFGFRTSFYGIVTVYLLTFGLAGALVLYRLLRRRGEWRIPLAIGFAPVLLLAVQGYGGEAIFRVILYALPGLSAIAAGVGLSLARRRWSAAPVIAAGLVLAVASAHALLGGWSVYKVDKSEATVWQTFNRQAPIPAIFLVLGPGYIANPQWYYVPRVTQDGNYSTPLFGGGIAVASNFSGTADYEQLMSELDTTYRYADRPVYLALSDAEQTYAQFYGTLKADTTDNLRRQIAQDPRWKVVTDQGTSQLYQLEIGS